MENLERLDFGVNRDILTMCVNGYTNYAIAKELDLNEFFVKDTIFLFLGFDGWERILALASPMFLFEINKDYAFWNKEFEHYKVDQSQSNEKIYNVLKKYNKLLEDYDGRTN